MSGRRWPTCSEGAVGSTPTYAPIRFSVNSQSSVWRPLCLVSIHLYTYIHQDPPSNILYKASCFKYIQHASCHPSPNSARSFFPFCLSNCGICIFVRPSSVWSLAACRSVYSAYTLPTSGLPRSRQVYQQGHFCRKLLLRCDQQSGRAHYRATRNLCQD